MGKFIGPRAVEKTEILGYQSFTGGEVYKVFYVGGETEIMTQKTFDIVATEEASDYTSVRDKQFAAFKREFYSVLGSYILSRSENENDNEARVRFLQESLSLVAEYSIKQRDIDVLLDGVANGISVDTFRAIGTSIDENYNRVTNFLWTGDDNKFIPGVYPLGDITFLETKNFLEKINAEKTN